jgi:hypothetical protein
MVSANVGLLNNYELYNSYRCINSESCSGTNYSTGYLNIGYVWWLINPCSSTGMWSVDNGGYGYNHASTRAFGARPSIIIKSWLEFTGDGTIASPYKIVGDKEVGSANELINTRLSGEYVKLDNGTTNQLFRIIGIEDNKTKIISMDFAENRNDRKFSTSLTAHYYIWGTSYTTGEGTWYTYLNDSTNGYISTMKTTYGDLFDSGLYYLGITPINYKLTVCANTTSGNIKVCDKTTDKGMFNVGLPRYGEIFATQQSNPKTMWLISGVSDTAGWLINYIGSGATSTGDGSYGARPTLHLKSTVKILSGSGTESDPYVVGL